MIRKVKLDLVMVAVAGRSPTRWSDKQVVDVLYNSKDLFTVVRPTRSRGRHVVKRQSIISRIVGDEIANDCAYVLYPSSDS